MKKISTHLEKNLVKVFTKMKIPVKTKECQTIKLADIILFMLEKF